MSATLLAVIIGSLCFSVGEGLRLTPFPNPTLLSSQDSHDLNDAGIIGVAIVAKYGPLDVPTQAQKRSKRQALDLASDSLIASRPVFMLAVRSSNDESKAPHRLSFSAPHSGRAPPVQS